MRLVDGDVQPRLVGVFNGQHFLFRAVEVERLEPEILTDAVLDVDDEIALLQFRPIRRLRQLMKLPARTHQLVAPENLRVGHHRQFGIRPQKTARQKRRGMKRERWRERFELFAPQFFKPLFLAVGAAENVQRAAFLDPALHLLEEHVPHLLGHLGFGRACVERAKRVERREPQIDVRLRRIDGQRFGQLHDSQARLQRVPPVDEKLVPLGNLTGVGFRRFGESVRLIQQQQRVARQEIDQWRGLVGGQFQQTKLTGRRDDEAGPVSPAIVA